MDSWLGIGGVLGVMGKVLHKSQNYFGFVEPNKLPLILGLASYLFQGRSFSGLFVLPELTHAIVSLKFIEVLTSSQMVRAASFYGSKFLS